MVTCLALKQLQTGTTASADMAELVLKSMLGNNRCGITTADNDSCALLRRLHSRIQQRLRAFGELGELEYTWRTDAKGPRKSFVID